MSTEDDYLFLNAENVLGKYKKVIWGGIFFLTAGIMLVVGAFIYHYMNGAYEEDAKGIQQYLPLLLILVPIYGASLISQGVGEKRLYFRASLNGLMVDERGISGPIALLEGPTRDLLRNNNRAVFELAWGNIESFIVEPTRGSKKYSAPPYYKVTIKGGDGGIKTSFFILRTFFEGREQGIIEYVKAHLGDEQIIFNDELTNEQLNNESEDEK